MMHGWGLGGIMDSIWEYLRSIGGGEQNDFFFLSLT
jgi:hypothetical protein